MEAIDELGIFWVAGNSEDKLSGRLVFDPKSHIRLSLVGQFTAIDIHSPPPSIRFHGIIGSRHITLVDCFRSGASFPSHGVTACNFVANGLFVGHHVNEGDAFGHLHLELSDLDGWVGSTGVEESVDRRRVDGGPLYKLTYTPDKERSARFTRGKITLRSVSEIGGVKPGIKVWPGINIEYDQPQPFKQIMRDAERIEKLVTLCIDAPSLIDKLVVTDEAIRELSLARTDIGRRLIEYRAPLIGYLEPTERVTRHQYRMLLTFDELGGIEVVARWVDSVDEFEAALDSMMSITYAKQMFGENRFLNVTYAAEAFHRETSLDGRKYLPDADYADLLEKVVDSAPEEHKDWVRDKLQFANQSPLVRRLKDLARDAGRAAKPLIGDKEKWAFAISQARNTLTHLGDGVTVSGRGLRHLTESVFAVARICMLRRTGVPVSVLEEKAESYNVIWYREELHETIADVRNQANARRARRSTAD